MMSADELRLALGADLDLFSRITSIHAACTARVRATRLAHQRPYKTKRWCCLGRGSIRAARNGDPCFPPMVRDRRST